MKNKSKHTPTPWKVFENSQSYKIGIDNENHPKHFMKGVAMARTPSKLPIDEANAAYIVRAANCHEELLDAVKMALDAELSLSARIPRPLRIKFMRQAIAKAEGK